MSIATFTAIDFEVIGRPQQVGSKTPWLPRRKDGSLVLRNGHPVIATMDSNKKSKSWMQSVRDAAAAACPEGFELLRGPVLVEVEFRFARPKSHFRTGKHSNELRDDAPSWHTGTPDLDKLLRSLGDSLTGVILVDDKQIASWAPAKVYTSGSEGAVVTVKELQ